MKKTYKNQQEIESRQNILQSQRKAYDSCLRKLDNLFKLKISPLNTDGRLLSDEEYASQKARLVLEKARLEEILNDTAGRVESWLDTAEKTFDFACCARDCFAKGSSKEKGSILQVIGSNLTLKDKKLYIQLKKPYVLIAEVIKRVPQARAGFEPKNKGQNERKIEQIYSKNPILYGVMDDVRTWAIKECIAQNV